MMYRERLTRPGFYAEPFGIGVAQRVAEKQ
jgi:hypothetical protein